MPIETDQQYLERVVKAQAEEIERLKQANLALLGGWETEHTDKMLLIYTSDALMVETDQQIINDVIRLMEDNCDCEDVKQKMRDFESWIKTQIVERDRLLEIFDRKVDYLEEIYDHYDPEEEANWER